MGISLTLYQRLGHSQFVDGIVCFQQLQFVEFLQSRSKVSHLSLTVFDLLGRIDLAQNSLTTLRLFNRKITCGWYRQGSCIEISRVDITGELWCNLIIVTIAIDVNLVWLIICLDMWCMHSPWRPISTSRHCVSIVLGDQFISILTIDFIPWHFKLFI